MEKAMNAVQQATREANYHGFVYQAKSNINIDRNRTDIDNPYTNNKPNAIVFVTQNSNPGGTPPGGIYNGSALGVWYHIDNAGIGRWCIFNQNERELIRDGAAFNVLVVDS